MVGLEFKSRRFRIMAVLAVLDAIFISVSFFLGLWLRYDFKYNEIPQQYLSTYAHTLGIWIVMCLVVFALMRLYNNILSFAGQEDLFRIVIAYLILSALGFAFVKAFHIEMPAFYYVFGIIFSFFTTVFTRFAKRIYMILQHFFAKSSEKQSFEKIMIIGAGSAGRMILREYHESDKLNGKVACFIDDNKQKKGCHLGGVPIVGDRSVIVESAEKYGIDKIIYAIPSGDAKTRKEILDICCEAGCKVEVVPGIYQIITDQVPNKSRKVSIQDLLGRDSVTVNLDEIYKYISGKVVMVTGGGGSIGSELCRQIALSNPKTLIIFDIYENNAYDIQMELKRKYPDLDLVVLIGSVRNTARLDTVLSKYHPDIVFHAAAHKHVPLMEDSPNEAIKNNVFGTLKMAQAAAKYKVKKFVLISTDKAVNPTNIMGASKRLCEMVVQMMNRECHDTDFVAVRFGNVLGSNGSVIPLFEKQIAAGGPVTVTHPDITRFFMTIPEAVSLVLQAGYYAKGGEIYVLDMGLPVKIDDVARNLIKLSGYEPDYDIKIEYTGLRPGEKLYEELLMDEEGLQVTDNQLIHIGRPIEMDDVKFKEQLKVLEKAYKAEAPNMKELVEQIVPTYHRQR